MIIKFKQSTIRVNKYNQYCNEFIFLDSFYNQTKSLQSVEINMECGKGKIEKRSTTNTLENNNVKSKQINNMNYKQFAKKRNRRKTALK